MRDKMRYFLVLCLVTLAMSGCGSKADSAKVSQPEAEAEAVVSPEESAADGEDAFIDEAEMEMVSIEEEAVALAGSVPSISAGTNADASGVLETRCDKAVIDYSNSSDGYVMVQFTASTNKTLKALVNGPTTQYQYNLKPGEWSTLPMSDGNGTYKIGIYENIKGTSYSCVLSENINVKLADEFGPFLRPNQYVNYETAPNTVKKAKKLCAGVKNPLKKVEKVYNFVVKNLKYDTQLAATVQSGYLPDLDKVLSRKKGICFDYAALMTGMLRSQGVPCKLVIGYAGTAYHAWISVYTEKKGWVDGAVYFDGTSWQRMDPTFASSSNKSKSVMKYIGNGKNYSAKYFY